MGSLIQTQSFSKKNIYLKLGFILILLTIGFISYKLAASRMEKGEVLSGKTAIDEGRPGSEEDPSLTKVVKQKIDEAIRDGQQLVQKTATDVAANVTDVTLKSVDTVKNVLFDTTVGNALKQIENLPKEEREKVKEYICK